MYTRPLHEYGDLMTVREFIDACQQGGFIDDDGYGYPVKDGMMDPSSPIYPSLVKRIPTDATHVHWFNR